MSRKLDGVSKVAEITRPAKNLKHFFSVFLWVGLVLLLISVIMDVTYGEQKTIYCKIIIELLKAGGIAVIVASLFDFASNTATFYKAVREFLEQIIVKKDFMKSLGDKEKKEILAAIISIDDSRTYNNINTYYERYIDHTIQIMRKCVRTDYKINSEIYSNSESGILECRSDVSYRIYPSIDGYGDINMTIDKDDTKFCTSLQISNSENKILKTFDKEELEKAAVNGDICGRNGKQLIIDLNKIGGSDKHLKIYVTVVEKGHDHWFNFAFVALQPTEGFDLTVVCRDGIIIKEEATFISGSEFHVVERATNRRRVLCDTWFNEGTGISIVAAKELT